MLIDRVINTMTTITTILTLIEEGGGAKPKPKPSKPQPTPPKPAPKPAPPKPKPTPSPFPLKFDYMYIAMLGIGLALGIFLGIAIYKLRTRKVEAITGRFRGDTVALVYDIDESTFDLVALKKMGENTYYSPDPHTPLIVAKPAGVTPLPFKLIRKPVLFVIAKRMYGFATNPDSLSKIGVASLAIASPVWDEREPTGEKITELLRVLASKIGEHRGEIYVNPDLRIAVSVKVPEVIRAIVDLLLTKAQTSMRMLIDSVAGSDKFQQVIMQYYKAEMARKQFWLKFLLYAGLAGLLLLIGFSLFGMFVK